MTPSIPPNFLHIFAYHSLPSTMDAAHELLKSTKNGENLHDAARKHGGTYTSPLVSPMTISSQACVAVWADTQSDGRGRGDRTWQSALGNVHLSYGFYTPDVWGDSQHASTYAFNKMQEISHMVKGFLHQHYPKLFLRYKAPNDLYLENGKCAGFLCEVHPDGAVILGCGINVVQAPHPQSDCLKNYAVTHNAQDIAKYLHTCVEKMCFSKS